MVTSDVVILTTGLAGSFFLEHTEAVNKGNTFFLDQDEELMPNLGTGSQGKQR